MPSRRTLLATELTALALWHPKPLPAIPPNRNHRPQLRIPGRFATVHGDPLTVAPTTAHPSSSFRALWFGSQTASPSVRTVYSGRIDGDPTRSSTVLRCSWLASPAGSGSLTVNPRADLLPQLHSLPSRPSAFRTPILRLEHRLRLRTSIRLPFAQPNAGTPYLLLHELSLARLSAPPATD